MKRSGLFSAILTFLLVEAYCQYDPNSDILFDDTQESQYQPSYQTQKQYKQPQQQSAPQFPQSYQSPNQNNQPQQQSAPQFPQSYQSPNQHTQSQQLRTSQYQDGFKFAEQDVRQQQEQQSASQYQDGFKFAEQDVRQQPQQQSASQYQFGSQYGGQQDFRQPPQTSEAVTASNKEWERTLASFSLNMLKSVVRKNPNKNVVISPFSVATILSYLQQVSTDQTQKEISDALYQNPQSSKNSYSSFIKKLSQERNGKNTLSVANSLFANQNVRFAGQAKEIARNFYNVYIDALDFSNPQSTARTINDWVKKHTLNVIEEIVSPADIKRNSECILLNSVYFKGVWQKMFDAARTKSVDYSPDSINNIKKPFMWSNDRYDIGDDDNIGARWLSMPYDGNKYAMVFVVPQQKHTLDSLLERMSSNDLYTIMNTGEDYKCAIGIPKFNVTFDLSLTDVLQELGIQRLFTANSQITKLIQSGQGKSVSSANQKSAISIDESGTVAASVTSIGVNTLSLPSPSELFILRLTEPFLAILVDKKNKVPLMITKIYEP